MIAKAETVRISEKLVRANLDCARKSFLLMFHRNQSKSTEYGTMLDKLRSSAIERYLSGHDVNGALNLNVLSAQNNWKVGDISTNQIVSKLLATENVFFEVSRNKSKVDEVSISPVIFPVSSTLRLEDKIELAFAAHVLDQSQKTKTLSGKVVLLGGEVKTIRLVDDAAKFRPITTILNGWLSSSSDPPPVVLNKHCANCEFQHLCRPIAEREDSLSLLARIGPKELARYAKKGIFTVKQLSFLYRPRKRNRRGKTPPVKHLYELQALALRTGNIYLHGDATQIPRGSPEIYLDIEAVPEAEFHYLIGVVVTSREGVERYQYWADSMKEEATIFAELIALIHRFPTSPIFHYGSFERVALMKLGKVHGTSVDGIIARLFNVNSCIFGKIYFPVRSNSLKDICKFLGFSWTSSCASGLQSIVWRYTYDETRDEAFRQLLLEYNYEDCENLRHLVERLRDIAANGKHSADIRFANIEGGSVTENAARIVSRFGEILKSAHGSYEQAKIVLRKRRKTSTISSLAAPLQLPRRQSIVKIHKIVSVRRGRTCPRHPGRLLKYRETLATRTLTDLVFSERGGKKIVTQYVGKIGFCSLCRHAYNPPAIRRLGRQQKYGHGLQAWATYHRMALRLPFDKISHLLEDMFNEKVASNQIFNLVSGLSKRYVRTEQLLLKNILSSPIVHADETTINIQGTSQYVWVITDGTHVVFRYTERREALVIHELLDGYSGVLCSDFYSGYDSVKCVQQKCWAHLIRDLNDDLRKCPFDVELEQFVSSVRDLIVPILEAVEKFGLKSRNLRKFSKNVDKFYGTFIEGKVYRSDLVLTYQKRFSRYRDKLFVFLDRDGVPWNNNMAERALRHIAVQRKISGSFGKDGILQYLLLLGVTQSCRFQNKSLLKFLLSGETDVDKFKGHGNFRGWRMR